MDSPISQTLGASPAQPGGLPVFPSQITSAEVWNLIVCVESGSFV